MMKNDYLPKISVLLQFGGETLALLCPDMVKRVNRARARLPPTRRRDVRREAIITVCPKSKYVDEVLSTNESH